MVISLQLQSWRVIEQSQQGGKIYLFLVSKLVKAIAPDPISNTNPIVKIIKKIIAIENPKVDTWYKVTATGNKSNISRSNIKNNIATI